jgi:ParB/RepB/Spo0J family partition protein
MSNQQLLEVAVSNIVTQQNGRSSMDKEALEGLAATIKAHGVLEPLIVKLNEDAARKGTYSVIAGHRRLAASKLAGLTHVPCIVRVADAAETAEIRAIENLQREDLSEQDEAAEVAGLVALKGMEAIPELAERTGLSPFYLRRLYRVTKLPAKAQQLWKAGKLTMAHLEQLLRVPEANLGEVFKRIENPMYYEQGPNGRMTAERLRDFIDKLNVELNVWPIKGSECESCQSNSQIQEGLFGFTIEKAKGARCMNPGCFRTRAATYYAENWAKSKKGKACGTSGPVFVTHKDLSVLQQNYAYIEKPKGECRVCDHFVTLVLSDTAEIAAERACSDVACFKKLYDKKKASVKVDEKTGKVEKVDEAKVAEARLKKRCHDHGWEQREEVYKKWIPGRIHVDKQVHTAAAALMHHDRDFQRQFWTHEMKRGSTHFPDLTQILEHLWTMDVFNAGAVLRTLISRTVLLSEYGRENRHSVYVFIGRNLAEDWTLTDDFLQKKTKDELVGIGVELGLFKEGEWSADTAKKDGLIKEIKALYKARKEKPVLVPATLVPDEVLNPDKYKEAKK